MPELLEGHARFCRGCGHDLLGLSGQRCPRCGRVSAALVYRPRPAGNGRWLVLGLLAVGITLALVGVKFRRMEPSAPPAGATTVPVATRPATNEMPERGPRTEPGPAGRAPVDSTDDLPPRAPVGIE
jgi:hypothetical protein